MMIQCQNSMFTWHNAKLKLDVALAAKIAKENGELTQLQVAERLAEGQYVSTRAYIYKAVKHA